METVPDVRETLKEALATIDRAVAELYVIRRQVVEQYQAADAKACALRHYSALADEARSA